ncbi:Thimet oligopeptidase [Anaeromyxobacter dehalogenans 2CP-1]|uniref:Thimet oligopeptidase n=1 Tax=Anaeromyxobacter dehalogenans (strain ATCC BAA-258 / DSM 21875 / 2CP-1) TaxID=455488 RepID=B8JAX2_ANAD2|nr:M3 family metallopeptidase [Anaeromyxobacter dehalogenans]ACL63783.1 Thimet oligopeptidase [Anaeromyxobacter dehalogenans 2CP-1]
MSEPLRPEASRELTGTPPAFTEGCRRDMDRARAEAARARALGPAGGLATLEAFDAAFAALSEAASRASLARNVHPDPALRDAAEAAEREVDALSTELSLDRGLYDALAGLDPSGLDAPTRHLVEKSLRDFRRAGVDRDDATRARVKALREELVRVGQEFGRNIKDDVRRLEVEPAALDGLPEDWRRAHAPGPDGRVTLTTDNTDYVPFLTYARSAAAREALWRLYRLRGHPRNLEVLSRMLARRADLARLLGYPSWAAYVTEDKMIGSDGAAADFIERIARAAEARMRRDHAQLLERKREERPDADRVEPWDSAWLQERVKAERYGFDSQSVRPYFEYQRVKQGVLDVTGRIFGIAYRRAPDAPVWHPEVEAWDVIEDGALLGRVYLDMHPRDGKYKHYAQFTLASGQAGRRLPEGVLVCNFPRPAPGAPALMEHGDVRTFFHEFGHLLHHVLGGHTRWAGQSGVATEWDFVEAPSQMLEEWVWDPEVLATFARHVDTGEPIPAELVARMKAADEYGKGLMVRQQMFYAATSLELHRRDPGALDTTALVAELQERYTPFRHVPGTYFQESFGHLDGYSAIYYTYMWSLVIAKDLFGPFREAGLLDPAPARRYRRAVLEPGGSKPAAELVKDFLGRPHAFDAFAAWLEA